MKIEASKLKRWNMLKMGNWMELKRADEKVIIETIPRKNNYDDHEAYLIRLQYENLSTERPEKSDHEIEILLLPYTSRTKRAWLVCPILMNTGYICGNRVNALYRFGDCFGCRRCYNQFYNPKLVYGLYGPRN